MACASASRAAAAQREDSLVRSLRATALAAMSRAVHAGATPAELAKGDSVFRGGQALATAGRFSEAMVELATAASLWTDVERLSRSRAARDTPRPVEPPARPSVAQPPADPRPDIEAAIARYARALESLDLNEVRRAYPGLTASQQDGWRQFFESVRRLKAELKVTAVNVVGTGAEVIVSGVYEYESTTGRAEVRAVTFRAILVAERSGWVLTAVR